MFVRIRKNTNRRRKNIKKRKNVRKTRKVVAVAVVPLMKVLKKYGLKKQVRFKSCGNNDSF